MEGSQKGKTKDILVTKIEVPLVLSNSKSSYQFQCLGLLLLL